MKFCAYDKLTGRIRARYDVPEAQAGLQIREGEAIYSGDLDDARYVIDVATGQPVDIAALDPGDGSRWNDGEQRWHSPDELREHDRRDIRAAIVALEAKQARPLRELRINPDDPIAMAKLTEIESSIAELRGLL